LQDTDKKALQRHEWIQSGGVGEFKAAKEGDGNDQAIVKSEN